MGPGRELVPGPQGLEPDVQAAHQSVCYQEVTFLVPVIEECFKAAMALAPSLNCTTGNRRRGLPLRIELRIVTHLCRCRRAWTLWSCLGSALLLSTLGVMAAREAATPPARFLAPVPRDFYADDVGRFLAGLPARPDSPFAKLQDDTAWKEHRQELDTAWTNVDQDRLPAMRAFQRAELGEQATATSPVFYPFSGPDALTVTLFFPQSPVYVMVGLEPAGTLPKPEQLQSKDLKNYLAETRATVASELERSFFITRQMDSQFRGQVTDGLCLPILELLVRSGHTVLGFRYVRLDDRGQVIERAADYRAPTRNANKGVEIDFLRDDDHSVHKLFYFSVNLSDTRLQENKPFLAFLANLQGATTFLKATSYMVHMTGFSIIRKQVLAESGAVLQDDSGVPYHYYLSPDWRVQLYGEYNYPYGSFRWLVQQDLRTAYRTQQIRPLAFRIGYGCRAIPSNLLYATKIK